MTAYQILQNNDAGFTPHINFKGFLLGMYDDERFQFESVPGIFSEQKFYFFLSFNSIMKSIEIKPQIR